MPSTCAARVNLSKGLRFFRGGPALLMRITPAQDAFKSTWQGESGLVCTLRAQAFSRRHFLFFTRLSRLAKSRLPFMICFNTPPPPPHPPSALLPVNSETVCLLFFFYRPLLAPPIHCPDHGSPICPPTWPLPSRYVPSVCDIRERFQQRVRASGYLGTTFDAHP